MDNEKLNKLLSDAKACLDDAQKMLAADEPDYEGAEEMKQKATRLFEQAKKLKEVAKTQKELSEFEIPEAQPRKAARVPFGTKETEDEPSADDATKSIYFARYGDDDKALKAVITDMYGPNYHQQRLGQHNAFAKYVRFGYSKLNAGEHNALQQLILTPDTIMAGVKEGFSVGEMKAIKTTQQENSLALGGALVPEDWRAEVLRRVAEINFFRQKARVVTTTRDHVEWPILTGGGERYPTTVRVTWVDEVPTSATVAQTNFTVGTVRIPVHTVMARIDVSRNLMEDAGVNILQMLATEFGDAMGVDEQEQFLTGTGSGRPEGILGERSGAEYTPVDGVGYTPSGNASALTPDGIIDLAYALDPQYLMTDLCWIGKKETFRTIRKMKDGNGDYLWQRGLERGAPPVVLDYDYYMSQAMPAVGANAYPLIIGNLMGYIIVDRVGMTVERVEDSTTVGQNKVAVFARRRLGGQVAMPWMFNTQKVATS